MIKRYVAAALAAAALAVPVATAPAFANHTVCDNGELTDIWVERAGIGADVDDVLDHQTLYICLTPTSLLVIRANGHLTYCEYYDWHNPSQNRCFTT